MVELQQQMRNNSEDLQDFLRDLGSWTKQMEVKDEQLKKKKKSPKPEQPRSVDELKRKPLIIENETDLDLKEKKSKSSDYDAWSKYDVDKALSEIETPTVSEVKEVELSAEMKIQKANMQKEKGNEHFKVPFYKSTQSSIYPKIHNF